MLNRKDCEKMKKKGKAEKQKGESSLKTGAILAALLTAVAVFAVMVQMEKKILTQYEKGVIYVAAVEIPKGEIITESNYAKYNC